MRPPRLRCTLFLSIYPPHLLCYYKVIVIRLCCFQPTYLSQPSLLCDFCPSDQRFAYSFLQIPPRDGHPCCSAIHFPLSGRVRDLHPLERAHGAQTKKSSLTGRSFVYSLRVPTLWGLSYFIAFYSCFILFPSGGATGKEPENA